MGRVGFTWGARGALALGPSRQGEEPGYWHVAHAAAFLSFPSLKHTSREFFQKGNGGKASIKPLISHSTGPCPVTRRESPLALGLSPPGGGRQLPRTAPTFRAAISYGCRPRLLATAPANPKTRCNITQEQYSKCPTEDARSYHGSLGSVRSGYQATRFLAKEHEVCFAFLTRQSA